MAEREADRNLLFGINALQNDFITREALIATMNSWALEKDRTLGEILVERGELDAGDRTVLEALIDRNLARHGGDASQCLAAISSVGDVTVDLRQSVAPDPELLASLDSLATRSIDVPYGTHQPTIGGPNSTAGRFRKVREHAAGNLGVVYIARDEELNREVALKEIRERNADSPHSQAKFLLEAEVTGGLEHPGIVPVYGLGHHDDGRPYYAMRLIRGKSLLDAIKRFHANDSPRIDPGRRLLELQKLLRRFTDVCNAIAYAHSRGILHRDLKPDNVMVGKYGETLVVDWGLAKAMGRPFGAGASSGDPEDSLPEASLNPASADSLEATQAGTLLGTPAYMSPEQAAGRLDLLGPASDVYGLGATLYHLLTGRTSIEARTLKELLARLQEGQFTHPRALVPWLDPALEAICLKAMALSPDDRYSSPRNLAEDLDRWIAGEPVAAYPEPFLRRAGRWAKRHQTALATTASAALASILLLVAVAWQQAAQRDRVEASARAQLGQADAFAIQARVSRDPGDWDRAIAEARQAEARLETGGGSASKAEVAGRIASLLAEQSRLRDALASQAKDRGMVEALELARLKSVSVKNGRFDEEPKCAAYQAEFRNYGIDLGILSVEEAARRIKASAIAERLISAIDDWSMSQPSRATEARLAAIARASEPDPGHSLVRDALERRDLAGLRVLCDRPEFRRKLGPRIRSCFEALRRLDPVNSLPLLEAIRLENPSDFWINHNLGWTYEYARPPRISEALRCYSAAVALKPESPGSHLNLGMALSKNQEFEAAIAEYRAAIAIQPRYAQAHNNLGTAFKARGDLEGAAAEFRFAIECEPRYATPHFNLGRCLAARGDLDGAIVECRKAIELDPSHADAHNDMAIYHEKAGKIEEALAEVVIAGRLRPEEATFHGSAAGLLMQLGRPDEAAKAYRQAILQGRDGQKFHRFLAYILWKQRKLDEAAAEYRQAIVVKPDDVLARRDLGWVLNEQGRPQDALIELRAASRIAPEDAEIRADLASILRRAGRLDEAIAESRESVRLNPGLAWGYQNLGWALLGKEDWLGAVPAYREAIRLNRKNADLYFELATALDRLGQAGDAKESYRQAVRLRAAYASTLAASNPYQAACLAAAVGTETLPDGPAMDEATRSALRNQAMAWLRVELAAQAKRLDGGQPAPASEVARTLDRWKKEPDLAGIRDEADLAKLPAGEREIFRAFWVEVEALLARAGG